MAKPGTREAEAETASVLLRLEAVTRERRQVEVEDLQLVLAWADLHRMPLATNPDGGEALVPLGGEGTPQVQELALCELGIARGVHTLAARSAVADALDLRHRLPLTWAQVVALDAPAWVARKVAAMSRQLPLDLIDRVDEPVAEAIATQSPSRVLELAAAKVIEADVAGYDKRVAAERSERFVGLGRSDEHGLRAVIARVTTGDAHWIDAMVARVAEILAERSEHTGKPVQELRSVAFGLLARPAELLTLLLENGDQGESRATAFPADLLDALAKLDPARLRPRGTLYVHLHEAALQGQPGVARVEGLGPHTLTALKELLGVAEVTVKGVIDVDELVSTSAYEHPEAIRERIHLRRPGDQFPHAASMSRLCDLDHMIEYDPHGPPDQTSTHGSQPLSRTPHRAKTHLGYQVTPLPTGETLWTTPHGLCRLVDQFGTTALDPARAECWTSQSVGERRLARALHRHRTTV